MGAQVGGLKFGENLRQSDHGHSVTTVLKDGARVVGVQGDEVEELASLRQLDWVFSFQQTGRRGPRERRPDMTQPEARIRLVPYARAFCRTAYRSAGAWMD